VSAIKQLSDKQQEDKIFVTLYVYHRVKKAASVLCLNVNAHITQSRCIID